MHQRVKRKCKRNCKGDLEDRRGQDSGRRMRCNDEALTPNARGRLSEDTVVRAAANDQGEVNN